MQEGTYSFQDNLSYQLLANIFSGRDDIRSIAILGRPNMYNWICFCYFVKNY